MTSLSRGLVLVWAVFVAAAAVAPIPAWAGEQIVRVAPEEGFESGGTGREQAMLMAVVHESEALLPGSLSPSRKKLLADFIQARYDRYILSYSQLAGNNPQERIWQVQVNSRALTSLLKDLGIYYTLSDSLSYSLRLLTDDGHPVRDRITELEALSGCIRDNVQYPVLRVQPASDKSWNGKLTSSKETWTAHAQDVDDLWLTLWSSFFSGPENIQPFVQSFDLRIGGWSTMSAISGFCKQLEGWSQLVDRASLLQITGDSQGLHARWQVLTPQRDKLEERLGAYTSSRGLDWQVGEGGGGSL